jgi:hypothetical protein
MGMSAGRACGALCAQGRDRVVERHGLASVHLLQGTIQRGMKVDAIVIVEIVSVTHTRNECMRELEPLRVRELEQVIEKRRRDGHDQRYSVLGRPASGIWLARRVG